MFKRFCLRAILCFGSARDLTNDAMDGDALEDDLIHRFWS